MLNVYKKSRSAQTFLSNYDYEDVGVFHVTTHSANTWSISPPELDSMIKQLRAPSNFLSIIRCYLISAFFVLVHLMNNIAKLNYTEHQLCCFV